MVNSLLTAIVRADGDALVMHVGERPYVVASSGPVELSSRPLTLEAVAGMLTQLLPSEGRRALAELGAVEHDLPVSAAGHGDRFTVVAARGGDDIWIEVRRHRRAEATTEAHPQEAPLTPPAPSATTPPPAPGVTPVAPSPVAAVPVPEPAVSPAPAPAAQPPASAVLGSLSQPTVAARPAAPLAPEGGLSRTAGQKTGSDEEGSSARRAPGFHPERAALPRQPLTEPPGSDRRDAAPADVASAPAAADLPGVSLPPSARAPRPAAPSVLPSVPQAGERIERKLSKANGLDQVFPARPPVPPQPAAPVDHAEAAAPMPETGFEPFPATAGAPEGPSATAGEALPVAEAEPAVRPLVAAPIVERPTPESFSYESGPVSGAATRVAAVPPAARPTPAAEPAPAVVLPLARNPVRLDAQSRALPSARIAGIDRLLRLAAARGANTLYLMAQARPSVRVDGEIAVLEGEPVLSAHEVESLLLDLAPERSREALEAGEGTEWMSEVQEVGRIRCQSFRDHRGAGGIFRMISARPTTAEQLGLAREIQALCAEPEGLVLVAGPRASGKSTLISALVDLVNRTRNDYVITIESQIKFAHESCSCLVSQREVRGGNEDLAMVVRAALRENPDVLVIEDMRSPEVVRLALEAMEAGHLVIGAVSAHGAASAIGKILDQFPEERRTQMQLALAEGLRGVVSQVLLRKTSGGRVAAREVMLNLPSIANLIAEGRVSQLPLAIDSGRKHGMVPLNDALAAFVQNGVVDVKEAYRKAFERQSFLAVLRREGLDTSFVERLA